MSKPSSNKQNFLYGASILLIANLLVKVIGAFFKIPLQHIVGDEVMGYYNAAYQIYALFFMISTAGLPVAVSKMIAQSEARGRAKEVERIFRIAKRVFFSLGLFLTLLMLLFARQIANWSGSADRYMVIMTIAPSVFFISLVSAYRGYYQGQQDMVPTSVSQVIEALTKLILGLIVGYIGMKAGLSAPAVASLIIGAVTLSVIFSFVYLVLRTNNYRRKHPLTHRCGDTNCESPNALIKKLIYIAIPITISASILNLTSVIDSMFVVKCLKSLGEPYTESVATSMYGAYTTMSVTIFNMPTTLIYPISISILPMISAALAVGKNREIVEAKNRAFRMVSIIVFPAAFGVGVLAKPILKLLFSNNQIKGTDIYPVDIAGPSLSILAISIVFVGFISITGAMLQAHGYEKKSIISNGLGVLAKFIFELILLNIPSIGIYGAPISTTICYFVMLACNLFFLAKYTSYLPYIKETLMKPFVSSVLCGLTALAVYKLTSSLIGFRISTVFSIIIAGIVYVLVLFAIKGISKEDILQFPKGDKIFVLLQKVRLVK
ncbi:MAG: polysaccharide biosynthesis protein [Firmicutes bacterium]|nr:polysaccharide biosynthesis protein [Bacillota bacterium]